ncbi:MAG: hypothetical protein ACJ789_14920 [Thermomicrobiales bacterium]
MSPMNRRLFAKTGLGAIAAALPLGAHAAAALPAHEAPAVSGNDDFELH